MRTTVTALTRRGFVGGETSNTPIAQVARLSAPLAVIQMGSTVLLTFTCAGPYYQVVARNERACDSTRSQGHRNDADTHTLDAAHWLVRLSA